MSNPTLDLMNQKFILQLNAALAMENAGVERLQTRIEEVSIPDVKQQLEHHFAIIEPLNCINDFSSVRVV